MGIGVLAAGAVALFAIAGPRFWKEIDSTTDVHEGTGDVRLEIWAAGIRMWKANPFLGVGSGNFRWVIGDYQTPEQFAKFGRSLGGSIIAHSLPVECLAELGSAGAIALLVLIVATWRGLGRVILQIPGPGKAPAGYGSGTCPVALLRRCPSRRHPGHTRGRSVPVPPLLLASLGSPGCGERSAVRVPPDQCGMAAGEAQAARYRGAGGLAASRAAGTLRVLSRFRPRPPAGCTSDELPDGVAAQWSPRPRGAGGGRWHWPRS